MGCGGMGMLLGWRISRREGLGVCIAAPLAPTLSFLAWEETPAYSWMGCQGQAWHGLAEG